MRALFAALRHFGYSIRPPDEEFLKWCLDQGLSGPLLRSFSEGWVEESKNAFGQFQAVIFDPDAIREEASNCPQYVRDGFLAIGSSISGDAIALDVESGAVVFLSHEHLWGHDDCDAREFSAEIAPSLDQFALRAVTHSMAIDYWETRKRLGD